MNRTLLLMSGFGLGAGLMYMLDPEGGGRRRTRAQAQLAAYRHRTNDFFDDATHTIGRQTRDLLPQVRLPFRHQQPGVGEMLLARVEQIGVSRSLCMLGCAALGAGVMYMLDPSGGTRRRTRMRDKSRSYWHRAGDLLGKTVHDVRNRTRGAETSREGGGSDVPSDTVLKARVQV